MKRFFVLLISLIIVVMLAVPCFAAEDFPLSGGYYITCDSALGNGRTFYVPADFAAGSLAYDSSGYLFNLTSSSIYLYCPDYPDYTIYASRFSGFQYRTNTGIGSNYIDLRLRNVTDTNVEILTENPELVTTNAGLDAQLLFSILIVGFLFLIWINRR